MSALATFPSLKTIPMPIGSCLLNKVSPESKSFQSLKLLCSKLDTAWGEQVDQEIDPTVLEHRTLVEVILCCSLFCPTYENVYYMHIMLYRLNLNMVF